MGSVAENEEEINSPILFLQSITDIIHVLQEVTNALPT